MQTLHYTTDVDEDGSITVEGLPPNTTVTVTIRPQDTTMRREELAELFADFRRSHPFMQMTKDEILARLRETREQVAQERYGH